jgi:hypothetical protein
MLELIKKNFSKQNVIAQPLIAKEAKLLQQIQFLGMRKNFM